MTRDEFLQTDITKISQVYSGKRKGCRCGCSGEYTATEHMKDPRSDVNNKLVEKRLKRAKKLVNQGVDVDYGDTYVDIQTGEDRTLTFYFDEVIGL